MSILEYSAIIDYTNHHYHGNIVKVIPIQDYKFCTLTSDRFDHVEKKWVKDPIPDPVFQDSDNEDNAFPDEGTGKNTDYFPRYKDEILIGNVGKLLQRCLEVAEGGYDAEKQHTIEDFSEKIYDFTKKQDVQDFIINWQSSRLEKYPIKPPVAMREPPTRQPYIRYDGTTNNLPTLQGKRAVVHSLRWYKKRKIPASEGALWCP